MKEKYNQAVNFLKSGKLDKAKVLCLEILEEQGYNVSDYKFYKFNMPIETKPRENLLLISLAFNIAGYPGPSLKQYE